jgi:GrpB protein
MSPSLGGVSAPALWALLCCTPFAPTRHPTERGMRVELVDPEPTWPALYEDLRTRIAGALGAAMVTIDHVGSTSVHGLAAKPVIDIVVTVAEPGAESSCGCGSRTGTNIECSASRHRRPTCTSSALAARRLTACSTSETTYARTPKTAVGTSRSSDGWPHAIGRRCRVTPTPSQMW